MNALTKVAISKAVREAAYSAAVKEIEVGTHPLNVDVRLQGTITRGEDYEQQIVEKADPWGLLAVALSKLNGVTIESLVREVTGETEAKVTEIKEAAKKAMEVVKGKTMTSCNGKVTASLTVEVIE